MKQLILPMLSIALLSGCVTLTSETNTEAHINVDKHHSRVAHIGSVDVVTMASTLKVRGNLKRNLPGKGPIYGHLHIDLVDADNNVVAGAISKPSRVNANNKRASFSKTFKITESPTKVRLTHHDESHSHS